MVGLVTPAPAHQLEHLERSGAVLQEERGVVCDEYHARNIEIKPGAHNDVESDYALLIKHMQRK